MVLNPVHPQDASLLEGPPGHTLRELPVPGPDGLPAIGLLYLGVEPLVSEHLGRPNNRDPRRVASLHGGHEAELRARGKEL